MKSIWCPRKGLKRPRGRPVTNHGMRGFDFGLTTHACLALSKPSAAGAHRPTHAMDFILPPPYIFYGCPQLKQKLYSSPRHSRRLARLQPLHCFFSTSPSSRSRAHRPTSLPGHTTPHLPSTLHLEASIPWRPPHRPPRGPTAAAHSSRHWPSSSPFSGRPRPSSK